MRIIRIALVALPVLLMADAAHAQLSLPRTSPLARTMQTVGLTEIEVEYSSPSVRGRTVWGDLVPYNQHWRTGANINTLVKFSGPVELGGTKVESGTYSLHSIPAEGSWTIILNRKTDGTGSGTYDESQDVLRYKAQVTTAPSRERLTFVFANTTSTGTDLDLEWAGLRVRIPVKVPTNEAVDKDITEAIEGMWRTPAQAARYLLEEKRDLTRAMELVDHSIKLEENWYNLMIKGRIYAANGNVKKAKKYTKKALSKGDESGAFKFYSEQMKTSLEAWSAKKKS